MKISDETKVGFFGAFIITLFVIGYNFLSGKNLFVSEKILYASYEKIEGIQESGAVMYRGIKVGSVNSTELSGEGTDQKVVLELFVKKDIPISKDCEARIISLNLLGEKAVELRNGTSTEQAQEGDMLRGTLEIGMQQAFTEELEPMKKSLEGLLATLDKNLDDKAFDDFKALAPRLNQTLGEVDAMLRAAKSNINRLGTLEGAVTNTLDDMADLTDSVKALPVRQSLVAVNDALAELTEVMNKLHEGEGTAAKLMNDPVLYDNLVKSTASLDELLTDLKKHPKHYFAPLGKKKRQDWAKD